MHELNINPSAYFGLVEFFIIRPYLSVSVALLTICISGMAAFRPQRRLIFLSALLSTPFCLYEIVFIPEYWSPFQEDKFIGAADFLFSFSTGGIAWMLAAIGIKPELALSWKPLLFCRRYAGGAVLGVLFSLFLRLMGLKIMTAVLVSIVIGLLVLAWRFRRLRHFALTGGLGFAVFYFLLLKWMFSVSSGFPMQWNTAGLSGLDLWGVPVEEILWAAGFGAIWPRFMTYVFDARLKEGQ